MHLLQDHPWVLAWEEEWARLEPVLEGFFSGSAGRRPQRAANTPPPAVSIDTYHPETARRAIGLGASIVNCVYAEPVPAMLDLLREFPQTELVMPACCWDLVAHEASLLPRLYLDPMIGFGTTREEDLELLRAIPEFAKRGRVLVGASRKRIVKRLTGEKVPGKDLAGNLAIAVGAALKGASVVRVHDVRETVQALKVLSARAGGEQL
jgi:dihydropteroate synthase